MMRTVGEAWRAAHSAAWGSPIPKLPKLIAIDPTPSRATWRSRSSGVSGAPAVTTALKITTPTRVMTLARTSHRRCRDAHASSAVQAEEFGIGERSTACSRGTEGWPPRS